MGERSDRWRRRGGRVVVVAAAALGLWAWGCGEDVRRGGGDGTISADGDGARWNNATQPTEDRTAADGDCGDALESGAMELLNAERAAAGLGSLTCHLDMLEVARDHSDDMIAREFFDHINPDGEAPWDRMDRHGVFGWKTVGENIAAGQTTAREVHGDWMNSPGHRANILTPEFTHAAIGVGQDAAGTLYWTQVFAQF